MSIFYPLINLFDEIMFSVAARRISDQPGYPLRTRDYGLLILWKNFIVFPITEVFCART